MSVYLDRKSRGVCTRCGVRPASETSVLCERHRVYALTKVKEHYERKMLGVDRRSKRILRRTAQRCLL